VITKEFARIHRQNLIDFGILPLTFENPADCDQAFSGDILKFSGLTKELQKSHKVDFRNLAKGRQITAVHDLSARQLDVLLAGGLINWVKSRVTEHAVYH
jgi:aconitate hydratase